MLPFLGRSETPVDERRKESGPRLSRAFHIFGCGARKRAMRRLHKKEPRGPEQSFMDCGKVFCKERAGPTKAVRQKIIIPLYRQTNNRAKISIF